MPIRLIRTDQIDTVYKILQWLPKPRFRIYKAQFGYHDTYTLIVLHGNQEEIERIKKTAEHLHRKKVLTETEFKDFMIDYEISMEEQKKIQKEFEEDMDIFWEISDEEFIKQYNKTREHEITAIERRLRR